MIESHDQLAWEYEKMQQSKDQDSLQDSQEVRDWIKEVVSNGYYTGMLELEWQVLGCFYEYLIASEQIDGAVDILLQVGDEATAGHYLNRAVQKALEQTVNVYKASVAAHLGDKAYYDQYF